MMFDFHMVVCVKIVPKPEEVRVDRESRRLDRANARSEINPPDMNALELALDLKDRTGGRISLLSMGPPFFEMYLRVGLAMGADHVYLLSDRAFGGADTLATTYVLAQSIRKIEDVDLVLCGEESSDGATGQVPAGLAEWLDLPQITLVNRVDLNLEDGLVRARRSLPGGHEIVTAPLPALLAVKTAANEPRFMDFRRRPWAMADGRVTIWDRKALAADPALCGSPGSPTAVSGLEQARVRERKRLFLQGEVDELAAQLAAILEANRS